MRAASALIWSQWRQTRWYVVGVPVLCALWAYAIRGSLEHFQLSSLVILFIGILALLVRLITMHGDSGNLRFGFSPALYRLPVSTGMLVAVHVIFAFVAVATVYLVSSLVIREITTSPYFSSRLTETSRFLLAVFAVGAMALAVAWTLGAIHAYLAFVSILLFGVVFTYIALRHSAALPAFLLAWGGGSLAVALAGAYRGRSGGFRRFPSVTESAPRQEPRAFRRALWAVAWSEYRRLGIWFVPAYLLLLLLFFWAGASAQGIYNHGPRSALANSVEFAAYGSLAAFLSAAVLYNILLIGDDLGSGRKLSSGIWRNPLGDMRAIANGRLLAGLMSLIVPWVVTCALFDAYFAVGIESHAHSPVATIDVLIWGMDYGPTGPGEYGVVQFVLGSMVLLGVGWVVQQCGILYLLFLVVLSNAINLFDLESLRIDYVGSFLLFPFGIACVFLIKNAGDLRYVRTVAAVWLVAFLAALLAFFAGFYEPIVRDHSVWIAAAAVASMICVPMLLASTIFRFQQHR
ncbi:MAG: hypothetical protein AMXMBFR84_39260 [Candidatus Hydrogenedentota bacterium]